MGAKSRSELPDSVDWRDQGAVSEVKNQGQCGSCWAFCTHGMIESYAAIETGTLPELSAQQVTACTPNPLSCGGTGGCYGSIPQLGYTYIQLFGHAAESDYPYTSGTTTETGDCMYDFTNTAPVIGITGYIRLARDAEAQCGTDSTPMDGTACVGGPGNDEQHVCGQCGVLFDVSYPLGAHDVAMP